jgi:hypothetical protein
MTIQLECISLIIPLAKIDQLIIPLAKIDQCYPGGVRALIGADPRECEDSFSHDRWLYREGAMSSFAMQMLIDRWEGYGLVPTVRRKRKLCWNDLCVVDRFDGPTLPCDWLEWNPDEATVRYKPPQPTAASSRRGRPRKSEGQLAATKLPSVLHQGPIGTASQISHGYRASQHPARDLGGWIGRRAFRDEDAVYPGAFPDCHHQVRQTLETLHVGGKLHVQALPQPLRLSQQREPGPLPDSRVEGILIGLAIGDALGNTSESMSPSKRMRTHGEIRHYLPNRRAKNASLGLPSDDTQLSVWTLETLLARGGPDLNALVRAYRQRRIGGIGGTMRAFFRALNDLPKGADAWNARQHSAGNGALMRVLRCLPAPCLDARRRHARHCPARQRLTHDDSSSNAACVALAQILAECLWGGRSIGPGFFWETFIAAAAPIEGPVQLSSRISGDRFRGSLCAPGGAARAGRPAGRYVSASGL